MDVIDTTSRRRTDTRERILSTAVRLFHDRGYSGTSIRDIAEDIGVTKAALYYHFRSKEQILDALLEPAVTGIQEVVSATPDVTTAEGRAECVSRLVGVLLSHRPRLAAIVDDPLVAAHIEEHVHSSGVPRRVVLMLAEGLLAGRAVATSYEARLRATATLGCMRAGIDVWLDTNPAERDMSSSDRDLIVRCMLDVLEGGSSGPS